MSEEKILAQAKLLYSFGQKMQVHLLHAHQEAQDTDLTAKDLSPGQTLMLLKIKRLDECTISKLAKAMNVSPPSASAMVERLVEKETVIRERSKKDRRVVVVKLTEKAESYTVKLEENTLQRVTSVIKTIGPEISRDWCDVVQRINTAIEKEEKNGKA